MLFVVVGRVGGTELIVYPDSHHYLLRLILSPKSDRVNESCYHSSLQTTSDMKINEMP